MDINIKDIEKLIQLIEKSSVTRLVITQDKESIEIAQEKILVTQALPVAQAAPIAPTTHASVAPTPALAVEAPKAAEPTGHIVKSPMVGTFYLSPSPGAPAFIKVGQKIKAGETLCIIEAMKMMNQIESDKTGTIKAILVETGKPVEFDQPLVVIE